MLIENDFRLSAPLADVWEFLQDVPGLAPCLPGAELTGETADGGYTGGVKVSMGPVSLRFTGTARIVESDATARRMVLHAAGSEVRGRGTAEMTVTATLRQAGAGATSMHVAQDLQISGAAAQYGRGMISDVTSVLLGSFTDCIAANAEARSRGGTAVLTRAAPASGFRIGLSAALMALRRVARRFFGPSTRPA
ncbi:SRPBCC family protein [Pseudonocardia sp.]|uniref:SRPBCC family protein n=1 Tax=Pseudonocardia sp. TaxID=60912 RepID=UPI003D14D6FE